MADEPVSVGVLSLHTSKETKAILNAVEALGHEPHWLRRDTIEATIEDSAVAVEPEVDIVVNRLLLSRTDKLGELLGLANVYDQLVPILNRPDAVFRAVHKFSAATILSEEGIDVPDSYLALEQGRLNRARDRYGDRAVYKFTIGTHGEGTTLVETDERLEPLAMDRQSYLQEFIETDATHPFDYRIYVVGQSVVGAMRRTAREGEFRTNVAEGGTVEDVTDELPDAVASMAVEATEAIGLDYAGLDVIERDGTWYVLEINTTAGFRGLFRATGVNPAPFIAQQAIERVGGSVDDAIVQSLTEELDDSIPSCHPGLDRTTPTARSAIGYTERVSISGTTGTETVIAKSDTGARRTSIDLDLAAEIGAGPIKRSTRVRSGLRQRSKARPVVDLVVGVGDTWHRVTASIEDRGHMTHSVLLGRDILQHYHVDVTREVEEE